ncbi:MAG: serine/threonine-protein kinase [Betaproteobacteria bacterium]
MSQRLPDKIGKYRVLSELGRGATSRVFLCEDAFLERKVAIKVIKDDAPTDTYMRRRFQRVFMNEAALTGKLAHPHIIAIYDAVTDDEDSYLVMEYVEGQTLETFCNPEALLPLERVVEIMFKASLALDYAYRHGVIHCDIKPANIMITGETDIKVTDFGAAFYDAADHTYLTGVGSPAYMSPEQVLEKQLNHQTDIYSLGVVLYQLLTGKLPFQGSNRGSLLYQILNIEAVPPSVHRWGVPPELDRITLRAVSKNLKDRYPTWVELSRDLAHVFKHLTLPEESISDTEKFTAVRALSFFRDFRDMEIWEALRLGLWHRFAPGEIVLKEGEPGDGFFVLTAGEVRVTRSGKVLDMLKSGHCFGEILYFQDTQATRSTTMMTHTACIAIEIKARSLREASDALQMQFNRAFMRVLVNRLELRETHLVAQTPARTPESA